MSDEKPKGDTFYKFLSAFLLVLLLIAGYLLLGSKITTCQTVVIENMTCNGSAVSVTSTSNATPIFGGSDAVHGLSDLAGILNNGNQKQSPVPEFPTDLYIGVTVGLLGILWYVIVRGKNT